MLAKPETGFLGFFSPVFLYFDLCMGLVTNKITAFPYSDIYTKIFVQPKKPGTYLHEQTGKARSILYVTVQQVF